MIKYMVKKPGRDLCRDSCIKTELIGQFRETICEIVNKPKATGKLEMTYSPYVGLILEVEFDSKEVLEYVDIWACLEWWAKSIQQQDPWTGEAGLVAGIEPPFDITQRLSNFEGAITRNFQP